MSSNLNNEQRSPNQSSLVLVENPGQNAENETNNAAQLRARNLQSFLNIVTSLQSSDNNGHQSVNVDPEKAQFLKDAMSEMLVDIGPWLIHRIQILKDHSNLEACAIALEEVLDQIDNIDHAQIFYQVGGLTAVTPLLKESDSRIRTNAADLIAVCCQNNPFCQKETTVDEVVETLVHMATKDNNKEARIKAIAALSGIIGNNPSGLEIFRKFGGLAILNEALGDKDEKFLRKICFMMSNICNQTGNCKDELVRLGAVEKLLHLIESRDGVQLELFWGALESLSRECYMGLELLKKNEDRLVKIVENLHEKYKEDAAYEETIAMASEVLNRTKSAAPLKVEQ